MSIWSSVAEAEGLTAGSGTVGAEPLNVDVATALSWGNRVRLAAWNDEEDFEAHLSPQALDKLIDALTKAREIVSAYQERVTIAPDEQENTTCAEA